MDPNTIQTTKNKTRFSVPTENLLRFCERYSRGHTAAHSENGVFRLENTFVTDGVQKMVIVKGQDIWIPNLDHEALAVIIKEIPVEEVEGLNFIDTVKKIMIICEPDKNQGLRWWSIMIIDQGRRDELFDFQGEHFRFFADLPPGAIPF